MIIEVVPEELTNTKLLELEQECRAEEEAEQKKTVQEKEEPHKKIHRERVSRSFSRFQQTP